MDEMIEEQRKAEVKSKALDKIKLEKELKEEMENFKKHTIQKHQQHEMQVNEKNLNKQIVQGVRIQNQNYILSNNTLKA